MPFNLQAVRSVPAEYSHVKKNTSFIQKPSKIFVETVNSLLLIFGECYLDENVSLFPE